MMEEIKHPPIVKDKWKRIAKRLRKRYNTMIGALSLQAFSVAVDPTEPRNTRISAARAHAKNKKLENALKKALSELYYQADIVESYGGSLAARLLRKKAAEIEFEAYDD